MLIWNGPRSFPEVVNFSKTYLGICATFIMSAESLGKGTASICQSIHPSIHYQLMSSACWPRCHRRRKAQVSELRAREKPAGPQAIGKDHPGFERLHKDRSDNREKMIRESMGHE